MAAAFRKVNATLDVLRGTTHSTVREVTYKIAIIGALQHVLESEIRPAHDAMDFVVIDELECVLSGKARFEHPSLSPHPCYADIGLYDRASHCLFLIELKSLPISFRKGIFDKTLTPWEQTAVYDEVAAEIGHYVGSETDMARMHVDLYAKIVNTRFRDDGAKEAGARNFHTSVSERMVVNQRQLDGYVIRCRSQNPPALHTASRSKYVPPAIAGSALVYGFASRIIFNAQFPEEGYDEEESSLRASLKRRRDSSM